MVEFDGTGVGACREIIKATVIIPGGWMVADSVIITASDTYFCACGRTNASWVSFSRAIRNPSGSSIAAFT